MLHDQGGGSAEPRSKKARREQHGVVHRGLPHHHHINGDMLYLEGMLGRQG